MAKNVWGPDVDDPGWDEIFFLKTLIFIVIPIGFGVAMGYLESGVKWLIANDVLLPAEQASVQLPYGAGLDALRLTIAVFVGIALISSIILLARAWARSRQAIDDETEYDRALGR